MLQIQEYEKVIIKKFPKSTIQSPEPYVDIKRMLDKFFYARNEFSRDVERILAALQEFIDSLAPCKSIIHRPIFGHAVYGALSSEQQNSVKLLTEKLSSEKFLTRLTALHLVLQNASLGQNSSIGYQLANLHFQVLNTVTEYIRIKNILPAEKSQIIENLRAVLDSDRPNLEIILKKLKKFYKVIKETFERLEGKMCHLNPDFSKIAKEYTVFIQQYFSGDLIELITLPYLPNATAKEYASHLAKGRAKIFTQLELYCHDCIRRCAEIIETNKVCIDKWPLQTGVFGVNFSGSQLAKKTIYYIFLGALQRYADKKEYPILNSMTLFLLFETGLSIEALCLDASKFDSSELFEQKIQSIHQQLDSSLQAQREVSPSWDEVHERDRRVLWEKEQQRRHESDEKAEHEQAILHAKNLELAKTKQNERRKVECKDLLLNSLRNNPNRKVNDQLSKILNGTLKDVLKDDFFAILLQLRLSGSEAIKKEANGSYSIAGKNNLTMTLPGFPQSFTLHLLHGKDGAEFVDKASVDQLKDMLAYIGMDSQSFAVFLQELAVPAKCGSPGSG